MSLLLRRQSCKSLLYGRYDEYIRRAAVPPPNPGQRIQDPEHVPFDALRAQPGSFEDNVRHVGGLQVVANKFRQGSLFDIRNLVPPMPTSHAILVIRDWLKSLLLLCVQFHNYSDECSVLRNVAQTFLPLFHVYGNHKSNIYKAQKAFNAGQWEKLRNRAQSNAVIRRARPDEKPRNNALRSDEQKVKYATTLAQKGNLIKANSIITKELIPAAKFIEKHPHPRERHRRQSPRHE